jgi:hypothetical protein
VRGIVSTLKAPQRRLSSDATRRSEARDDPAALTGNRLMVPMNYLPRRGGCPAVVKGAVQHQCQPDAGPGKLQRDILLGPGHVGGVEALRRILGKRRVAIARATRPD